MPAQWFVCVIYILPKILLLLPVFVLSGCLSANPEKALRIIGQLIPPGTPQAEAILIMKQHGYDGGQCGSARRQPKGETIFCFWHDTKILKNSRYFFVHFKNGKVATIEGWRTDNYFFDFLGSPTSSG